MIVYLNGEYLPESGARVSVDDRGFLFADGVYEVIRVYGGRPFLMEDHLARLRDGLAALQIELPDQRGLARVAERLLEENGLGRAGAAIYLQVTRGAAPRKHAFPENCPPTVFMTARAFKEYPTEFFRDGVAAITVPDTRWSRCDIKSIALLPNVLANQQAHAQGAFEALFVKDGVVIEGSHSNLLAVVDGALVTYPACNYILPGITRALVLKLAADNDIPVRLGPIYLDALGGVDELFLSGTTTEILPLTTVDGATIGNGSVGPVTRRLQQLFGALVEGA